MLQFQSLDCIELEHDKSQFLRTDTSISCHSQDYQAFRVAIGFFIFIYQSIPCMWFILLWRVRDRLDPLGQLGEPLNLELGIGNAASKKLKILPIRATDASISHLAFLWSDYEPSRWYFEVIEMYRRIFFIGFLPLLGDGSLRASMGSLFAIIAAIYIREVSPFIRGTTNVLLVVAQYQILLTFFAALIIISSALAVFHLHPLELGILLLLMNCSVLVLSLSWCVSRYMRESQERLWRNALTSEQLGILEKVMGDKSDAAGTKEDSRCEELDLLKKHLLNPKDVELLQRVGAGSFGEVFKGSFKGQPVAVKTMLNVTEKDVRAFRSEILLTATFRHPNIVHFVGACWGQELVCLVLEWVPKGSLTELLNDQLSVELRWEEPLLRLAMDIARGMSYIHGTDNGKKAAHIHRDLKAENVLVSAFLAAKITDFGTSRELSGEDVTMTAVGTPLYCAPEVMRGEYYDEKADLYSFGLLLIDMAVEESLLDFIGVRWRVAFDKKKVPSQPMRIIRPMNEDGWRPVTENESERIGFAPIAINSLIVRCCSHDPALRPTFEEVELYLSGVVAEEVAARAGGFGRYEKTRPRAKLGAFPPKKMEAFNGEDGCDEFRDHDDEEFGTFSRDSILANSINPLTPPSPSSGITPSKLLRRVTGLVSASTISSNYEKKKPLEVVAEKQIELTKREMGSQAVIVITAAGAAQPTPGWQKLTDQVSGRDYYSNLETGEVSWEASSGESTNRNTVSTEGTTNGSDGFVADGKSRGQGDTTAGM